jgi:hypothetical protein
MVKTTVYLDERDAAALRRISRETGRSQAEIIREGIRNVTGAHPRRRFAAMGIANSGDGTIGRRFDEVLRESGFGEDGLADRGSGSKR